MILGHGTIKIAVYDPGGKGEGQFRPRSYDQRKNRVDVMKDRCVEV